jgi:probable biosynthetic protein (TIGR04099 family)
MTLGLDRLAEGWAAAPPESWAGPVTPTRDRSSRASILLGMPQLDACGLSENWLQKTCGDRHWQALARLVGRRPADWRAPCGDRVYAAFGYLRLSDARLEAAQEDQRLTIDTHLGVAGRAQVHSRHRLSTQGRPIAALDLLSSFVARESASSNSKVRRIEGLLPACDADPGTAAMRQRMRTLRAAWIATAAPGLPSLVLHPCPRHDFNGAGLLYFASFSAWVDRALWQWGQLMPQRLVRERECVFLGNADPGEAMCVRLMSTEFDGANICWQLQLSTVAEERPLAVVRLSADTRR